jgi:hypothetical protein
LRGASGYDELSDAEKERRIRGFADALSSAIMRTAMWVTIELPTNSGITDSEFNWLVDELKKNGVMIKNVYEAYQYISANGTASGDGFVRTFTDASDYRLRSGSPAINAGVDVGLTTDYDGKAIKGLPDIGAYEYQSGCTRFPCFPTFGNFPSR